MPKKENSTVLVSCAFDRDDPDTAVLMVGRPSADGKPKILNAIPGKEAIELWDKLSKKK